MTSFLGWGIRQFFGGVRRGSAGAAGLGAAISILSWVKSRSGPDKELLYAANLSEGETLKIRFLQGRTVVDETEIEG